VSQGWQPWIQTFGRIAIHHSATSDPTTLRGSTRTLLALLVAAGTEGASVDEIADVYWTDERPRSWQAAIRLAASHLSGLLPDEWTIETTKGDLRIVPPPSGCIDAWRVEREFAPGSLAGKARPYWLQSGAPFADIADVPIIDQTAARLRSILGGSATSPGQRAALTRPLQTSLVDAQRVLLIAPANKLAAAREILLNDQDANNHVIVGDRGLFLPLGPFAITFPQLRDEIQLRQGRVEPDTTSRAWRILADVLTEKTGQEAQRILIVNAHELDPLSRQLVSLFLERGPLGDVSIVLLADAEHRDIRWLDFINRAVTAGCAAHYA